MSSVEVEATLGLPAALVAPPGGTVATIVPSVVMPETATV
jgi:hypothetical protein